MSESQDTQQETQFISFLKQIVIVHGGRHT